MREETAIELLRLASELTITTVETEGVVSPSLQPEGETDDIARVFADCASSVLRAYREMIDS